MMMIVSDFGFKRNKKAYIPSDTKWIWTAVDVAGKKIDIKMMYQNCSEKN